MKRLTAALFMLLLACAASVSTKAQGGDAAWLTVSPKGERFSVQMPESPAKNRQQNSYGGLTVNALVYKATQDKTSYALWSLKNLNYSGANPPETEEYLDACAELVWESLLKPERDRIPQEPGHVASMSYVTGLSDGAFPGREYTIRLDTIQGVANLYVSGESLYVLMVLNALPSAPDTLRFLNSFADSTKPPRLPVPATIVVDPALFPPDRGSGGIGPGRGGGTSSADNRQPPTAAELNDPNKVFNTRQVSQKARIITRPEPMYTESARKFGVTGTIVLRAVFAQDGEVKNIKVMKRLPHGLTEVAIMVARQIKFLPAQIDGRPVSQYIQIEYNFNLY
jgi:TonB family protein